jgi:glycerophosphoryl diester phosphodiesterase
MDCDMVELDVLLRGDELVVAHRERDFAHEGLLTLEAALAALFDQLPSTVGLNIDLKGVGFERQVVDALGSYGLSRRTLISTMESASLPVIRAIAPDMRLGWSVPRARVNYLAFPLTLPVAHAGLAYYRSVLPGRAMRQILRGWADTIMAHWGVVTPQLCDATFSVGGELYVWTVDDRTRLTTMENLGVTGVITNKPPLRDVDAAVPSSGGS